MGCHVAKFFCYATVILKLRHAAFCILFSGHIAGCGRYGFGPGQFDADSGTPTLDAAALDTLVIDAAPDAANSLNIGIIARFAMDNDPQTGTTALTAEPAQFTVICPMPAMCPTATVGRVGTGAYHFDNFSRLEIGDLLPAVTYSVAVWLNPSLLNPFGAAISKIESTSTIYNVFQLAVSEQSNIGVRAEGLTAPSPGAILANLDTQMDIRGGWHHVVVTQDATSRGLFVDGIERVRIIGTFVTSTFPVALGADLDMGSLNNRYIGDMDDLRFYDRVLSQLEISLLAQ